MASSLTPILSVGKVINSKEHLFEVLDLSTVWLKVGVLEKDLAQVAVGQSFELTLTAYPNENIRRQVGCHRSTT